jgi:hypothetical protein
LTIMADTIAQHIISGSGITSYAHAPFRDDQAAPFNNAAQKILLTMGSGGRADEYISQDSCKIFLFTKGNATGADIKQCRDDCETVRQFLIEEYKTGSAFGIQLIAGVGGPFFDGQNRKAYSLDIRILSNT